MPGALTPIQQMAQQSLASWNGKMDAIGRGLDLVDVLDLLPDGRVPALVDRGEGTGAPDPAGLAIGPDQSSLDEDLQSWTLTDQHNAAFIRRLRRPSRLRRRSMSSSGGVAGRAPAAITMRAAFVSAQPALGLLGEGPGRWQWGKLHTREFPSLIQAATVVGSLNPAKSDSLAYSPNLASPDSLGYGPMSAGGDVWTVDTAEGGMDSEIGPSWRMIAAWSRGGRPFAEGIYPGGQSENPASPWYTDLVGAWWSGNYLPMPAAGAPAVSTRSADSIHWELRP